MTELFRLGVEAAEGLPPDRQDLIGALLLKIVNASRPPEYTLTREQIEDLKLAIAEADRGEFATDEEMEEFWRRFER